MFRLYVFFISFVLTFAPAYVYANAASAFGGWSIGQVAASAGQATINATKNIGGQVVKSYAQVAPTAGALAKNIGRVGAVLAVDLAIKAILGAVDYVMDPANNRVIYTKVGDPTIGNYCYNVGNGGGYSAQRVCGTAQHVCNRIAISNNSTNTTLTITGSNQFGTTYDCAGVYPLVPQGEVPPPEKKYLPYDTVAAEIAKNAAAGDAAANDFVADTANPNNWDEQSYPLSKPPIVQQLDTNAGADAPPTTDNPPIDPNAPPTDPTKPFVLPAFCSWAAFICNAMNISNSNSQRAATASEQTRTNTAETNTKLSTMQGELINNGKKTDELKGAVVNAASAANTAATAQKDATKATTDAVTDLKGAVVNAGSAANAAATAQKDATKATTDAVTDLKGEVVNQGTKIGDIATSIKDLISTSIDRIVDAITAAKDAVKDAVDAGTAENTRIGDKAHEDATAQKEATEDQTKKDEKHREWEKEQPTDMPPLPVAIDEPNLPIEQFDKDYVRYNAQCPPDINQAIEYGETTVQLSFGYSPICDIAVKAKPFVIGAAGFAAFLIVAGVRRE